MSDKYRFFVGRNESNLIRELRVLRELPLDMRVLRELPLDIIYKSYAGKHLSRSFIDKCIRYKVAIFDTERQVLVLLDDDP